MKIAIQFYGHLRTFRKCHQSLKENFLKYYDADIFIHTWDQTEHNTQTWYTDDIKSKAENVDEKLIQEIKKLYNPKGLKIEKQNLFFDEGYYGTGDKIKISLKAKKYQLYSLYTSNKLRKKYSIKNSIKYDYVVVMRPDILPLVRIELEKYKSELDFYEKTSIHFVLRNDLKTISEKIFYLPFYGDCFFFSTPNVIDTISSIYQEFDFYHKNISSIFPKGVDAPEISFFEYIAQKNIVSRMYVNYYSIKRKNDIDDISLIPPDQKTIVNDHKKIQFVKYFLKIILIPFPSFIKSKIKIGLKALANFLFFNSSDR